VDGLELQVQRALQEGLPIVAQPYQALARQLGASEAEIIACIEKQQAAGLHKRFGMVLRHRQLGYTANAMVVWNVDDEQVSEIGELLGREPCVTLSYRRPRRPPRWPYNLFCMIHGKSREEVLAQLQEIIRRNNLQHLPHKVLFSTHCFKQRGAVYV
jgi:DNA-binding Lrp family transcriptional regulator